MSVRVVSLGLLLLLSVGCRGRTHSVPAADDASSAAACGAQKLGLGAAKAIAAWQPPPGCMGPSGGDPVTLRSEVEFKQTFHCPSDAPSGVNFAVNALVVSGRTLSPAGAGTSIVDDGSTVTFITLSRTPCANSPLPMPMSYTLAFLLPAGEKRAFAEKGCTLEARCE